MTTPTAPYLGYASVPANADLDTLGITATNAGANATAALAAAQAALPLAGGTLTGDLAFALGHGLLIREGVNATMGRAVLVAGTVTVSNTLASDTMEVFLTHRIVTTAAHTGALSVGTVVAGTSFVINSTNAADDATVSFLIVDTP
jgi:hypothetical protein